MRTYLGWSELKVVATVSRTGTGRLIKVYRSGKVALFMAMSHVTVGIPHRSATALFKGSVVCERRSL